MPPSGGQAVFGLELSDRVADEKEGTYGVNGNVTPTVSIPECRRQGGGEFLTSLHMFDLHFQVSSA